MPEVRLEGCRPEPLGLYLKALGILRLVAEQKDPEALGYWEDVFVLHSLMDEQGIISFFSREYRPTPIVAPWNKDSGFYRAGSYLATIERSADPRLDDMREAVRVCRDLLRRFGWKGGPGRDEEKAEFIAALRARLPDASLRWLDAVVALSGLDRPRWAPTFGAGGVDGRFEFTGVFAKALVTALGLGTRRHRAGASPGLRAALFGRPEPDSLVELTAGLVLPGSVDAPNAAQGFMGGKQANPWDYVLAVEGTLFLAGAVTRRFGSTRGEAASQLSAFPFTVTPAGAGHYSAGSESSRGELWLPLWSRPTTARELAQLFREGRAEWRGRPAATATDMARAIVSLGVDRGLREFRRFGVQGRAGRSHLAVSLGRQQVAVRPEAELLADIDPLLNGLRTAADRSNAHAWLLRAFRRLEAAIMAYAAYGGRDRLEEVLVATAAAELAIARRPRWRGLVRPLPALSPGWVQACDDGSLEFELAAAVASLRPAERGPGPFRRHLEPVILRGGVWAWPGPNVVPREVVWTGRDVLRDLTAVLERRLVDAEREGVDPPLDGRLRAHPAALAAFLADDVDSDRLGRLAEALGLVDWDAVDWGARPVRLRGRRRPTAEVIPATYAVVKLAFLGRPVRAGSVEARVRPDPTILGLLAAGDVWGAVVRAAHRLRAAGLTVGAVPLRWRSPLARNYDLGRRLAAALVVPVHEGPLVRAVLDLETEAGKEEGMT